MIRNNWNAADYFGENNYNVSINYKDQGMEY